MWLFQWPRRLAQEQPPLIRQKEYCQ